MNGLKEWFRIAKNNNLERVTQNLEFNYNSTAIFGDKQNSDDMTHIPITVTFLSHEACVYTIHSCAVYKHIYSSRAFLELFTMNRISGIVGKGEGVLSGSGNEKKCTSMIPE